MRLIDADRLMAIIKQRDYMLADRTNSKDRGMFTLGIQQAVNEQPTVDAKPVVHAKWDVDEYGWFCTNCHEYLKEYEEKFLYKFCPNCGARMDVEKWHNNIKKISAILEILEIDMQSVADKKMILNFCEMYIDSCTTSFLTTAKTDEQWE